MKKAVKETAEKVEKAVRRPQWLRPRKEQLRTDGRRVKPIGYIKLPDHRPKPKKKLESLFTVGSVVPHPVEGETTSPVEVVSPVKTYAP